MKRILFLEKKGRHDRGVALITVVLVLSLVVGLIVLALSNSMVGRVLSITYMKEKTILQCAQGDLDLANQLLVLGTGDAQKLLGMKADGITVDPEVLGGKDDAQNNLIEEIQGNKDLAFDSVTDAVPDIKINNPNIPTCSTSIDIDFLFHDDGRDVAVQDFSEYHTPTGGVACGEGDFYSITALTTSTVGSSTSLVRSGYYKCASG